MRSRGEAPSRVGRRPRWCRDADCQAGPPRDDPVGVSDCPDFRLTIRRDTVLAVDWHPWLVSGGPMTTMLRARGRAGVAIADVTVLREDDVATEAVVRFLAGDGRRRAPPSPAGRAMSATGGCGSRTRWWSCPARRRVRPRPAVAAARARLCDGGPEFWQHVRAVGRFPATCPLCGADLPQWRVCQRSPAGDDPSSMPATTRRTRCA